MTNHLTWIDCLKGSCMICVYLCHSEGYYGIEGDGMGFWVKPFYVNAFFFVSGYLFFGKWLEKGRLQIRGGYRQVLRNLLFRLVIPSILFSTLIYLPKVVFHGGEVGVVRYLLDVFGGTSYWFTSALAVAQLLLLSVCFAAKKTHIGWYVTASIVFFAVGSILNFRRTGSEPGDFFPWFYMTGLEYTLVMALGGVYRRYEARAERWLRRPVALLLLVAAYLAILGWALLTHTKLHMMGLGGLYNVPGVAAMVCGVMLVVILCKRLKVPAFLLWTGRNSIVFYFFSGVYPALVGTLSHRLFPGMGWTMAVPVTAAAVLLGGITTYGVMRYAPFLVDLRKTGD